MTAESALRILPDPLTQPLAETVAAWLDELRPRRGPLTIGRYAAVCRRALASWSAVGITTGAELSPASLRAWQGGLSRLRPATRRTEVVIMRALLRWAAAEGWVSRCDGVLALPRLPHPVPRALDRDAVATLLATVAAPGTRAARRDVAWITLLVTTGLRIAEACGIDRTALRGPGPLVILGKGDRERTVMIPAAAWSALRAHWADRTDAHPAALVGWDPGVPAVRLTPNTAENRLRAACSRAGLPPTTPHQFRHTFATELLATMGDLRLVQVALGHRSVVTTERYTAVAPARLAEGSARTAERLLGADLPRPEPVRTGGAPEDPGPACPSCGAAPGEAPRRQPLPWRRP